MALINCPECGKQISDKSEICIGCGYPIKELYNINSDKNISSDENDSFQINDIVKNIVENSETSNEVKMIKELRELTGLGLKEASDLIKNYIKEKDSSEELQKYWCKSCYRQNEIGKDYCDFCGNRLTSYWKEETLSINNPNSSIIQEEKKPFNGIYKVSFWNGKIEVYCPRCGSENCSYYTEQRIIPGKTKTRYTANLNPLRPFTLVNKKEKIVKKDTVVSESKIICNDCGKIFD